MNFPNEPLFRFFYWLINTPGLGSATIALLVGVAVIAFALTLRWIASARNEGEESLPYPPEH